MAESTGEDLRTNVALACRILAMFGVVSGTAGHVSARIPGTDEMWIRCRGGNEDGLLFTDVQQVRRVDFDGRGPGLGSAHAAPHETPIHGEIYRAHPEVQAVVHAHPPYALLCGITRLEFRPLFGAYDPSALAMIMRGIPVFPHAVTVTNKELAADMLACMGQRDVLLMQGHGITATGRSVEAATSLALRFDKVAHIMWQIAQSGLKAYDISAADMARYAPSTRTRTAGDTSSTDWQALPGVDSWPWRHYLRLLKVNNIGWPNDADPDHIDSST
jgi:ribulose-5-phosphate 4-epimerase/fuculose-1-phosphate aldolase